MPQAISCAGGQSTIGSGLSTIFLGTMVGRARGVTRSTAAEDRRFARAWLAAEMSRARVARGRDGSAP
jgi:hypothetical protein